MPTYITGPSPAARKTRSSLDRSGTPVRFEITGKRDLHTNNPCLLPMLGAPVPTEPPSTGSALMTPNGRLTKWHRSTLNEIKPIGMSDHLWLLYTELDYVTPKHIRILDTVPPSPKGRELKQATHMTRWWEYPDKILMCIDSEFINEEILAHELMHPWLHYVEGYEDYRQAREDLHPAIDFLVNATQSMLIDEVITERLTARGGFDMRFFAYDHAEMLYENHLSFEEGHLPRNRMEIVTLAQCYTQELIAPHNYRHAGDEQGMVNAFVRSAREHAPDILSLAKRMSESVRRLGYRHYWQLPAAVDACLHICFQYLGVQYEPRRILEPVQEQIADCGKQVGKLDFLPARQKHMILRNWVRHGINKTRMVGCRDNKTGTVSVTFRHVAS